MAGRLPPTRLYRLLDQVEIRELTDYPPSLPSQPPTRGIPEQASCDRRCAATTPEAT
jgi:hypothetical protein